MFLVSDWLCDVTGVKPELFHQKYLLLLEKWVRLLQLVAPTAIVQDAPSALLGCWYPYFPQKYEMNELALVSWRPKSDSKWLVVASEILLSTTSISEIENWFFFNGRPLLDINEMQGVWFAWWQYLQWMCAFCGQFNNVSESNDCQSSAVIFYGFWC